MPCVFRTQIGARVSHTATLSKLDYFRLMGKRTDGSHTILEVEHLSIAIICSIHFFQIRIGIQHRFSRFYTIIFYQLARNANPLAAFECTQLCFRVCVQLLGNILLLTSLDVQLASSSLNTASASAFFATSPQSGMHSCSTKQNIRFMSFIMHFSFPKLFFLLLPE